MWLNSEPLGPTELRGHVVLVDFWTLTCINWMRTQPHVRAWWQTYRDDGFVVIGVHGPEAPIWSSTVRLRARHTAWTPTATGCCGTVGCTSWCGTPPRSASGRSHLLRGLRGIGDLDIDPYRAQRCWTQPASQALLDTKAAAANALRRRPTALDADLLAGLRARYDQAVGGILTNRDRDWPSGRHPGYLLATRLQARAANLWRSTIDFAVPFTNNPGEQPQRMVKLQMKIGGCWRSVRTAARYGLVRSYLTTARHHAIHPSTPTATP